MQSQAPGSVYGLHTGVGEGVGSSSSSGLPGGVLRAASVASPSATGLTSSEVFDVGGLMVNVEDLLAGEQHSDIRCHRGDVRWRCCT